MNIENVRSYLKILVKYGPRILFQDYRNRSKIWHLNQSQNTVEPQNTSVADSNSESGYLELCDLASRNDDTFNNFRSNFEYRRILEHVSYDLGRRYLAELKDKYNVNLKSEKVKLIEVNRIGGPLTFSFSKGGKFSPTVLRYLKVAKELEHHFGPLDGFTIAEIGIGFGGQPAVLHLVSNVRSFYLYDLPEVQNLAKIFLKRARVNCEIEFLDGRAPSRSKSDLVLSNYAYSELSREVQTMYLTNVISNSKRGYITWNHLSARDLDGYSLEELLELIPNSKLLNESPLTSPENKIIIWGNKFAS